VEYWVLFLFRTNFGVGGILLFLVDDMD
jgi:hypothetical protein